MRHKIVDDVNVKVDVDLRADELGALVDKIGENVGAIVLIYMAADTARHILKSLFK